MWQYVALPQIRRAFCGTTSTAICVRTRHQKVSVNSETFWFLISELGAGVGRTNNSEIRNQKVSVNSETFWCLISELGTRIAPIQKSEIIKFLKLQKLSGFWFLHWEQGLLGWPIQKSETIRILIITRCSWQLRAHTLHTKVLRHAEIDFNYFNSPEAPHHIYQNDMF